jgi:hypothetical protein
MRLAIAISRRDHFKRTAPIARRRIDQKINRTVEVPQQSFILILASLLNYFYERGYRRTIGVVRFAFRFNARVKVGPIEHHLVSKAIPTFQREEFHHLAQPCADLDCEYGSPRTLNSSSRSRFTAASTTYEFAGAWRQASATEAIEDAPAVAGCEMYTEL